MRIVLLDTDGLGNDIDLSVFDHLDDVTTHRDTGAAEMADRIKDANVLITSKLKLNRRNLSPATELKLICVTATGYDNIDLPYCRERGISVCNVPGYSADSVAQLTLAMVLSLSTHLSTYRDYVHSGTYTRGTTPNYLTPIWHELAGMTWGIVGCGSIGQRVASVAETMGCRVLAYRRSPDPRFQTTDLDTLLGTSDIVTIHLPLNDQTRGLLSREKIALMKPGAIVINVARGPIADEAALAEAIETGALGALGVDVYSEEPLSPSHPYNRLLDRPNVIFTPHCAWGSQEARNRCIREVAKNIDAFLRGEQRNRVC